MLKLCEYAKDNSTGITVDVVCTLVSQPCGMIRYCTERMCPVMNGTYTRHGCKIKEKMGGAMARKKKNVESKNIDSTAISQNECSEICKVNYVKGNSTSISHLKNGKLVSIFVHGIYHGEVEVIYIGELCSKNIKEIRQI